MFANWHLEDDHFLYGFIAKGHAVGGIQALGQLRYLARPRSYGIRIGRHFGY